jgi:flagellar biosynthesis protein FlhB
MNPLILPLWGSLPAFRKSRSWAFLPGGCLQACTSAVVCPEEDEGKTEEPTEYKLKKAREEGRVAKSPDLVGAIGLLLDCYCLGYTCSLADGNPSGYDQMVSVISIEVDPIADAGLLGGAFLRYFASLVIPLALVAFLRQCFRTCFK